MSLRTPEAKKKRADKYDTEFIVCIRHSNRRCNRCAYVKDGHRQCSGCRNHTKDGKFRPSLVRFHAKPEAKEQRKWVQRSRRLSLWIEERKI